MTGGTVGSARAALAELLRSAGSAHHQAFAATNGDDPEWPVWYARYLAPRMAGLLHQVPPVEALAEQLHGLDAEYRAGASQSHWSEYYADWFLARQTQLRAGPPPSSD